MFITLLALVTLPLFAVSVNAQDYKGPEPMKAGKPVWRNDPMYSIHNYKHPNKAAAVQRRSSGMGVTVNVPLSGVNQVANYKMPAMQRVPVGGITVPHSPDLNVANRNYKMPRPQVTTIEVKTDVPTRSEPPAVIPAIDPKLK